MIDKNDVEKTFDTARHALSNRSELAWIGKSSLSERAYFMGIFIGLSGIVEEDHLLGEPFVRAMTYTLSHKHSADNTFASTTIGHNYQRLTEELLHQEQPLNRDLEQMIEELQHVIDRCNDKWQSIIHEVRTRIEKIIEIASESKEDPVKPTENHLENRRYELHQFLHNLEPHVRRIALLETDLSMKSQLHDRFPGTDHSMRSQLHDSSLTIMRVLLKPSVSM